MDRLFRSSVLLIGVLSCMIAGPFTQAQSTISPVVQLVSYSNPFGLHVERLGWGSASVINNQGLLLSNNHVIDDGSGNTASAFSVCVTKRTGQPPVCDYTATLLARDVSMDVSLLRIDPIDVHGNSVAYDEFMTVAVDYSYEPTVRDEVVIVGYPWVGSNTITETKGIVGGITEYNEHQYIKTDAIIASGNSGGAMLSRDGKLVGVPTFTMGGMMDSSLGYGLLLAEAQEFIETHQDTIPETEHHDPSFARVQKELDTINSAGAVRDPFVSFRFSPTYEIVSYIPKQYIELRNKSQKDSAVQALSISFFPTPTLTSDAMFTRYLEALGVFDSDYDRLLRKSIGGYNFYYSVNKNDSSNGTTIPYMSYYAQTAKDGLIQIEVAAPLGSENTTLQTQVLAEIEAVLKNIEFTKTLETASLTLPFALRDPQIEIKTDLPILSFPRLGIASMFLDDLRETIVVRVSRKDSYTGKGQTAAEMFRGDTTAIAGKYKSLITVQGIKGYIACSASGYLDLNNFSTYDIPFQTSTVALDGSPLPELRTCAVRLVEGLVDDNATEYTLDIIVSAPPTKIASTLDRLIDLLREDITLPSTSTEFSLPNPYTEMTTTNFSDISEQSTAFQESLAFLVHHGLLDNNTHFRPYQPMRWNTFLPLYIKALYGVDIQKNTSCTSIDLTCQLRSARIPSVSGEVSPLDIITKMNITLNAYVPEEQLYTFHQVFRMHLAGIPLTTMSERELTLVNSLDRSPDGSDLIPSQQLRLLEYTLYGGRPTNYAEIYDSVSFIPFRYFLHHPRIGLIEKEAYFDTPQDFNGISPYYYRPFAEGKEDRAKRTADAYQKLQNCTVNISCLQEYLLTMAQLIQEEEEAAKTYTVLSKGAAYGFLLNNMDVALFDPSLTDN